MARYATEKQKDKRRSPRRRERATADQKALLRKLGIKAGLNTMRKTTAQRKIETAIIKPLWRMEK